jgi:hypothetical protein
MEKENLGLVGAAPLSTSSGTIRIQKGDMLREDSTRKVVKIVNVYRAYEGGEYFVECENMEPGNFGTKTVPLKGLSLMMG